MSEDLFSALLMVFIGGLILLLIWGSAHQRKKIQEVEHHLYKIVQQAGGQDIDIWHHYSWTQRGVIQFILMYVDANGIHHKHRVKKHWSFWGRLEDDFYWDKPLQLPGSAIEASSNSKDQIINEMDAEIKRLQEELRRARKEG